MPDWNSPLRSPYIFLVAGIVLLSLGVASTCTGQVSGRFRWVYHTEEPGVFWWLVAIYFLGGVLFIGIYLCQ